MVYIIPYGIRGYDYCFGYYFDYIEGNNYTLCVVILSERIRRPQFAELYSHKLLASSIYISVAN